MAAGTGRVMFLLLPPKVEKHYSTRPRGHCYQLPRKTSVLDEDNFFYRVLYRNILSFKSTDYITISISDVLTAVCLFY